MINISLVSIITDKNKDNISLFNELKRFYGSLLEVSDNFELIIVNSCSDNVFNNDLNIFCANNNYCKVVRSYSSSLPKCLELAMNIVSYDNIILLNNELDAHPLDLDYILINYSTMKESSCFALFESSNSSQGNILGVVIDNYILKQVINYMNTNNMTEFLLQLCMLYYYIGRTYRINNRTSYFKLYKSTIKTKGFFKLKMKLFILNCKKLFPNKFKLSDKGNYYRLPVD